MNKPRRSRWSSLLNASTALTSAAALVALAIAAPAQAQTPVPPGPTPPYVVQAQGTNGPAVPDATNGVSGGSPANPINLLFPNIFTVNSSGPAGAVQIIDNGGNGSDGGTAVNSPNGVAGGNGGNGAAATSTNVTFDQTAPTGSEQITINTNSAATPLTISSHGGNGGSGGAAADIGMAGASGAGANAGDITWGYTAASSSTAVIASTNYSTPGVLLLSIGGNSGNAGDGSTTQSIGAHLTGPSAAAAGNGGNITATVNAGISWGLTAVSSGGNGGNGGSATSDFGSATGGNGGAGGSAGEVNLALTGGYVEAYGAAGPGTGSTTPFDSFTNTGQTVPVNTSLITAAVLAVSGGGLGGQGGDANATTTGKAGSGGPAGNGALTSVDVTGTNILTQQYGAVGIVAASIGGAGGNGAQSSSLFRSGGGNGAPGGNGDIASVALGQTGSTYQTLTTMGPESDAVVALSVGGGGGYGGDVYGGGIGYSATLGGNGANGGNGGPAYVDNGYWIAPQNGDLPYLVPGYVISTTGYDSRGIGAASVGGGGGRGGSAFSAAVGLVALGIGGVGGQGGDAGPVSVQNTGIIQTAGVQSPGMDAMSIGGGGGDGGAAMALAGNAQFTAAAAVGGKGGTGGVGNTVSAYNMHQILTFGSDSYGISAQSVGGGGGNGGATVALALQSVASEEIPSISLSASIGGSGGQGGTGNDVEVLNSGLLGTSGPGAFGVLAQSIGGGGGTGGDSSALQTAYNTPSINVAVAVGGNGGSGGDAGAVTVFNSGFLYTLNDGAAGIQAQSVGGGGGDGGYGRTNAGGFNSASGPSVTTTVAVGGYGGAGGNGGDVTIYNYANPTLLPPISLGMPGNATPNIYGAGGILTMGDSSDGVFAQSVGGGGGNGGNAIANGSGGNITVNVAIGGYGGAGGAGGSVLVDNGTGAILTKGANSAGIFAQSVGGGGGTGGSAATGSGADPQFALAQYIANGMGTGGNTQNVANNIWDWKDNVSGEFSTTDRLLQIAMGYEQANQGLVVPADSKPSVSDLTVDIGGGRAGKGGSAGNGGAVTVLSAGQITTEGALAAGIVAQSVGGGGGDGGAANPSTSNDKLASTIVSGSVAVGGDGGSSGDGGAVSVTNSGSIATAGDISAAILAQSIGGGGGVGGATAATAGAGSLMRISIGSVDGAWGAGGAVSVNNSGTINTGGESAYGVLAQSIGGGGGLAGVMGAQFNPTTGGSDSVLNAPTPSVDPSFAGASGGNSSGGTVTVNASGGAIITGGTNASAIVAQSIGGGGGIIATDGKFNLTAANVFATLGTGSGNGGTVTVNDGAGTILTNGDGAAGILAQSLATGGIIQGLDGINVATAPQLAPSLNLSSSGGAVQVSVRSSIVTTGAYAPGIFAQSAGYGGVVGQIGGGGFTFAGGARLSCPSCGNGAVTVNVGSGGYVAVGGSQSWGVVMLANGNVNGQNSTVLNVSGGGRVIANGAAAGAVFTGGSDLNNVFVSGQGSVIDGSQTASGIAIATWSGNTAPAAVQVFSGGDIKGSNLLGDGSTLSVGAGGTLEPGAVVDLGPHGTLTNNGTLNVGGAGTIATTTVTGTFVQGASGVLQVDANNVTGQADLVAVQGTAQLGGSVVLNSSDLSNRPVTVLTATGGVTMAPTLQSANTYLIGYQTSVVGNAVQVQPYANFTSAASGLSAANQGLAANLQQIWDSGAGLNGGFSALAAISDPKTLGSALSSIAGASVRGVAATRQAASERFFDNMINCESVKPGATPFQETNCGWLRVGGYQTNLSSDGDAGFHQTATTYQIGGQYEFSPGWFAGASLGLEQSWLTGDATNVTGTSGLGGLMIKHQTGPWLLTGEVDGGFGGYQSSRTISVGSQVGAAQGSPNVGDVGVHARAAYQVALAGSMYLQPSLTLGALYTGMSQYTETGTTSFNLNVHGSNTVTASVSPMVELGAQRALDDTHAMRAFIDLGMAAYSNNDWRGDASLALAPAGTGSFIVDSKLPAVVGKAKAGIDVHAGAGLDLRFVYSVDAANGFLSQAVLARLSYAF